MSTCTICGEEIPAGSRTCSTCGSSVEEFLPTAALLNVKKRPGPPASLPAGGSYCPACAAVFGPEHADSFCACGAELVKSPPPAVFFADEAAVEELPMAPILDEPLSAGKAAPVKPDPGTPCLVLYGPDKRPVRYFPLTKDATLIGRLDAVAGNFPDIDLDEWFDRTVNRKVSRQHALILRSRSAGTFVVRPLAGNTGTQLETQMLTPLQDYPLRPGHRIILGGAIRLKFEVA